VWIVEAGGFYKSPQGDWEINRSRFDATLVCGYWNLHNEIGLKEPTALWIQRLRTFNLTDPVVGLRAAAKI